MRKIKENNVLLWSQQEQQRLANSVARAYGFGRATAFLISSEPDRVLLRIRPGYVKNTTGEHVSNAYRNNFGWKNTHYQCASVMVNLCFDRTRSKG